MTVDLVITKEKQEDLERNSTLIDIGKKLFKLEHYFIGFQSEKVSPDRATKVK